MEKKEKFKKKFWQFLSSFNFFVFFICHVIFGKNCVFESFGKCFWNFDDFIKMCYSKGEISVEKKEGNFIFVYFLENVFRKWITFFRNQKTKVKNYENSKEENVILKIYELVRFIFCFWKTSKKLLKILKTF